MELRGRDVHRSLQREARGVRDRRAKSRTEYFCRAPSHWQSARSVCPGAAEKYDTTSRLRSSAKRGLTLEWALSRFRLRHRFGAGHAAAARFSRRDGGDDLDSALAADRLVSA